MEIFAGSSVLALVLVALFIATKTVRLWLRTRGLPELLLSGMLISATVLGYPLAIASTRVSAAEMWPIHAASQVIISVGYTCLLLFTLNVFRPKALWAKGLVGLTILTLVATSTTYIAEVRGDDPPALGEMTGTVIFTSVPIALAYLWTTVESFAYHRRLRLQVGLGLTDVVVANRVLLWGLMCLSAGAAVVISNGAMLLGGTLLSPAIVVVCSILGLAHAACLFLAFHPPGWYTTWLQGRSLAEVA
jgi:hypothetical protein